jgi:hypothetical protein
MLPPWRSSWQHSLGEFFSTNRNHLFRSSMEQEEQDGIRDFWRKLLWKPDSYPEVEVPCGNAQQSSCILAAPASGCNWRVVVVPLTLCDVKLDLIQVECQWIVCVCAIKLSQFAGVSAPVNHQCSWAWFRKTHKATSSGSQPPCHTIKSHLQNDSQGFFRILKVYSKNWCFPIKLMFSHSKNWCFPKKNDPFFSL